MKPHKDNGSRKSATTAMPDRMPAVSQSEIKDTYYNMLEKISDYRELIDNAFEALRESGIDAKAVATRGGTDGARMSWEGLPCPNLGTGGANCHGRHECISVQKMDKMTEVLERLVAKFA